MINNELRVVHVYCYVHYPLYIYTREVSEMSYIWLGVVILFPLTIIDDNI